MIPLPYIDKEQRPRLDSLIDELSDEIIMGEDGWEGRLNYTISRLANNIVESKGKSYRVFNALLGVMACVKQELYRRVVVPYERIKCYMNGDVFGDPELD